MRVQKFRRFAQSLVEDHKTLNKQEEHFGELRSKEEKDRFDRKVKEFEAAHPHVDLTPIYENDKTEAARKVLHKKAYASYKAFHFLKNGIKKGSDAETAELTKFTSCLVFCIEHAGALLCSNRAFRGRRSFGRRRLHP